MARWLYSSRLKHVLCSAMAVLILAVPVSASAQESEAIDPCFAGQGDAELRHSSTLWLAAGCLLGPPGMLLAFVLSPNPPAARLIGKSPQWVAAYSDCYKDKARDKRFSSALVGCFVGLPVLLAVIGIAGVVSGGEL